MVSTHNGLEVVMVGVRFPTSFALRLTTYGLVAQHAIGITPSSVFNKKKLQSYTLFCHGVTQENIKDNPTVAQSLNAPNA